MRLLLQTWAFAQWCVHWCQGVLFYLSQVEKMVIEWKISHGVINRDASWHCELKSHMKDLRKTNIANAILFLTLFPGYFQPLLWIAHLFLFAASLVYFCRTYCWNECLGGHLKEKQKDTALLQHVRSCLNGTGVKIQAWWSLWFTSALGCV